MDVFSLLARISLDTSEYEDSLSDAESKTSNFGSAVKGGLKTATKIGATAMVALGTTVVAGSKALVDGVSNVASYGDSIDKMSQKMGISAEAYQEWDFIMQHSGTSMETLKASMKTLSNAVENGNEAFERLGITQEDIATMSQEELFAKTISELQNLESGTERTYLAGQLLGRGATELGALLNTSAEDTEAMRQAVHDLGGVMSDEAVKDSARFQDSLQDAQYAVTGLKNSFMSELLPSFADVLDGFSAMVSGADEGGEQFAKGIESAIDSVMDMLPRLITVGGKLVISLVYGIVKNLPKIVSTAKDLLKSLIDGILNALPMILGMLPQILSTVMDLIFDVIDGILDALPQLIDMLAKELPTMISTFISKIIENLPRIIEGLIQVILSIAENLPTIITGIIDELPHIIELLISALLECLPQLIEGAIQLVMALVEHTPEIIMALIEAIPDIIDMVVTAIIENFPKIIVAVAEGLLKLLNKIGTWFAELIGFVDEEGDGIWDNVGKWFENAFKDIVKWLSQIWSDISSWFSNLISDIVGWFSDIWSDITGFFSDVWEKITSFFSDSWNEVTGKLGEIWTSISGWITNTVTNVGNFFSDLWGKVTGFFSDTLTTVTTELSTLWTNISTWFTTAWSNITGFISEAYNWGANLVKGIWSGVSDWAGWLWDRISGFFDNIWSGIKDFFGIHSPSTKFAWIAEMDVKGLANGLEKFGDEAIKTATALSDDISEALNPTATLDTSIIASDIDKVGTGTGTVQNFEINFEINGMQGDSVDAFTDEVIYRIQRIILGDEAVYA